MATTVWSGAVDSTWTTDGNWSGVHPAAADDAILNSGAVDVTGVDESATNLNSLFIASGYTGDIGSSGAYLIVSADNCAIRGGGDIYLDSGGTAAHDDIRIESASSGTTYLKATTTCPLLVIRRGNVNLVSGTFTAVYLDWNGVGSSPTLTVAGATVTTLNAFKTCTVNATSGTVTNWHGHYGTHTATGATVVTNLYVYNTASYTDNSSATPITLVQVSGTTASFDASDNPYTKVYTTARGMGSGTININDGIGAKSIGTEEMWGTPVLIKYA